MFQFYFGCSKFKGVRDIWKTKAPSKVKCFGWRLVLNSLPTISELFKRGVLLDIHRRVCRWINKMDIYFYVEFVWGIVMHWLGGPVGVSFGGGLGREGIIVLLCLTSLWQLSQQFSPVLFCFLLFVGLECVVEKDCNDFSWQSLEWWKIMKLIKSLGLDWFSILSKDKIELDKKM